ncbi:MAG: aldolase/citrate lyase family protein [Chloroflexota bacterium]|nr:aldolase/citrate lyase family protein [Chloroflexota bacterium]
MKTSGLKAIWRDRRPAFGGWCSIPSSFSAEIVASLGFDYVCIDMQHGLADFGDLVPMLQAVASYGTPLVRVPVADYATAQRALDAGAEGLIFPLVNSRAEAEAAVASCRYPPLGARSYGPVRSRLHLGADVGHANAEVACIVMIETAAALDHLDEILDCPGVDAVYVGPNDLALGLGVLSEVSDPPFNRALETILEACVRRGTPAGIHTASGAAARAYVERGFSFATVTSDAAVLSAAYRSELATARGAEPATGTAGTYG